ncbi:AraC family transcriptional regulator [Hankyongella ginsenosidimutans]|uniref:AraC family transcriptional regulator n=1 Tax=Hankyongella ginsenosidimutans TaxID=1763828 RepID=UPI001FEBA74C|nr:AraC family transcriptional regulator [Hankyongella ginsenosidimutans]
METAGIRSSDLLHRAQLPLNLALSADGVVTTDQYFGLMTALGELSPIPAIGLHLVEHADTAAHPPSTVAAFMRAISVMVLRGLHGSSGCARQKDWW